MASCDWNMLDLLWLVSEGVCSPHTRTDSRSSLVRPLPTTHDDWCRLGRTRQSYSESSIKNPDALCVPKNISSLFNHHRNTHSPLSNLKSRPLPWHCTQPLPPTVTLTASSNCVNPLKEICVQATLRNQTSQTITRTSDITGRMTHCFFWKTSKVP